MEDVRAYTFFYFKEAIPIREYLKNNSEESLVGKFFIINYHKEHKCFFITKELIERDRRFTTESFFQDHHNLHVGEVEDYEREFMENMNRI